MSAHPIGPREAYVDSATTTEVEMLRAEKLELLAAMSSISDLLEGCLRSPERDAAKLEAASVIADRAIQNVGGES